MNKLIQSLQFKAYSLKIRLRKLADDSADGVWRTVRGRRVFIGKGQSLEDALGKSLKSGNGVIQKPSETGSGSASRLEHSVEEAEKARKGSGINASAESHFKKARESFATAIAWQKKGKTDLVDKYESAGKDYMAKGKKALNQ